MSREIIIWGAGGHARVIFDILQLTQEYHVFGFIDDTDREFHSSKFLNCRLFRGQDKLDELIIQGINHLFVAIGDCRIRKKCADLAVRKGFKLATIVHPHSVIANDVILGNGTAVMAGAVVNPGVKIGNNVIINTSASVDHECFIEDGVHIGPGVRLGGLVQVAQEAWVGIGAIARDRVAIGASSIVGAGSVVVQDIPAGVIAYGVPAKVIRTV